MLIPTKDPDKKIYVNSALVVAIIALCIVGGYGVQSARLYARNHVTCDDFLKPVSSNNLLSPQERAQMAFEKGAVYLDKNRDGIACNKFLNKYER